MTEKDVIQELEDFGITVERNEREIKGILKNAGTNPQAGLIDNIEPMEKCKNESDFWAQFRGDYLDLRDFLKAKTRDDKKTFLKGLSKGRVILIREHLLQAWTFQPQQRDILEDELEAISLIIYSGKDELEMLEKELEDKKLSCGYYADAESNDGIQVN